MFNLFKILNFLIICYFFLRLEIINNIIPSIWFGFLLIITFLSLRVWFSMSISEKYFLFKKNIWILISLIILSVYKFKGYGNFRLDYFIQYLISSIPFLIIGYYYSIKNVNLKQIIFPFFILTFLAYLPSIFIYIFSGNFEREFLKSLIFRGNINSGLIHFWPFFSALIITTYGFYTSSKPKLNTRIFLKFSALISIVFIFLSGYMSGVIFIIISGLSIIYFNSKFSTYLKSIIGIPLALYFGTLALSKLSVGAISSKANGFILFINSGFLFDEKILNIITSSRSSAIIYSITQFIKKPFFGHGVYLEEVTGDLSIIEKYTTAAGGHSFFIDSLAFMGLFSVPIIFIYINFIKNARIVTKININTVFYKQYLLIYALFVSVFISNILNSWLLFSSFDNFIFLLAGYIYGQLYLHYKKNEHKIIV